MNLSSGPPSDTHSGTVGVFMRLDGADQNVQLFAPGTLRQYALAWRKQWAAPFSCDGYQGICPSMGCSGVGKLNEFAQGWGRQFGSANITSADRGIISGPQEAVTAYMMGIEACMQADDWRACAEKGDLASLRTKAIRAGVDPNILDPAIGLLSSPLADEQILHHSIMATCVTYLGGKKCICDNIATVVSEAAMSKASWLLTASGQSIQNRIKAASVDTMPDLQGRDPQGLSAGAVPVLQTAWQDTVAALNSAWMESRAQIGLPAVTVDFTSQLKKYLLENGWNTQDSLPWQHGTASVWLVGTSADPLAIDPGSTDNTTWPWAAAFKNWDQAGCDRYCKTRARDGLFTLYSLLRIEPLQQALRQGLRDIAVMVAHDALPYSSAMR